MFLAKKILTALILPPTGPILLALFGLWLSGRKSRLWWHGGRWLTGLSLLGLLALSLPVVSGGLMRACQPYAPISRAALAETQAIVVLGGGTYRDAPEYGSDTVDRATLERLRYAAKLARDSRLPLLVTGGSPTGGRPEGEIMAEILAREFGTPVRWIEAGSKDTEENARYSAPMLRKAGIQRIAVISNAWHLPRALPLFAREGFAAVPAPMAFGGTAPLSVWSFVPSAGALDSSETALKELIGRLYNHLSGKS